MAFFLDISLSMTEQIARLGVLLEALELSLLISSHVLALPHDIHRRIIAIFIDFHKKLIKCGIKNDQEFQLQVQLPKYSNQVIKWITTVVSR